MYGTSVPTSRPMWSMRIVRINQFILYREMAGIFYCEEYTKHMNTAA